MTAPKPAYKFRCIRCGGAIYRLGKSKLCKPCVVRRNRHDTDKRVLAAIIMYKAANDGLTPTAAMLAKLAYANKRGITIEDAARAAAGQPKQLSGHAEDWAESPLFAGVTP